MFAKIIIIVLLILMVVSLGVALYFMMTDRGRSNRTVHALALRVGIWVVLFAFIGIGIGTGFIKPSNSIEAGAKARSAAEESSKAAENN